MPAPRSSKSENEPSQAIAPCLDEKVSQIRDFVNHPRKLSLLLQEPLKFNRLCSAMDAVGDTVYAIAAHAALNLVSSSSDRTGLLYLAHFGFMQALYLQQAAVRDLCAALSFLTLSKRVEALDHIKQLRDDVAHMTDRDWGRRFVGIVRATMTPTTFELYGFGSTEKRFPERTVVASDLAREQGAVLATILEEVIKSLADEERQHKAEFRDESLAKIFEKLDYPLGKICQGAACLGKPNGEPDISIGSGSLQVIEAAIAKFEDALKRRGRISDNDHVGDYELDRVRRAIARLNAFFSNPPPDPLDAEAMALLLQNTVKQVIELAEGMDRWYADDRTENDRLEGLSRTALQRPNTILLKSSRKGKAGSARTKPAPKRRDG